MDSFPSANGCKLAGWLGHRKDFEIKVLQNRFTTQKKSEHIYVWRTLLEKLLETWGTSSWRTLWLTEGLWHKALLQAVLYLFLFIFTSYKIFTSSSEKISLLYLNFVENFRHTCAFSRSSSLLWRTLMLPIKADLFFRFWRLEMITLLPWILEICSQSCEMIYKFSLALKWPRFRIEILSVSQFSSLFIIIEELFRMIYPKGHPVARQEGRVLFNPSQTCADPSRSPPMMLTTNHSTGSVWSTEPVCRSSAPYLNHNPWVLTRCSHEIAFVRIDDTWAHQNNLEELVFLLRSMSFDLDTYYLRCHRSSKIFYFLLKEEGSHFIQGLDEFSLL